MEILEAIDRIRELSNETTDEDIVVSSKTALITLDILQDLGFTKISIDQYNNM
jgi:hypothetical protein